MAPDTHRGTHKTLQDYIFVFKCWFYLLNLLMRTDPLIYAIFQTQFS